MKVPAIDIAEIARICHEANRMYCRALGDYSQRPWHDAPAWQRESAINGVKFGLSGDRSPEDSHNSWLAEKALDGWKYGPVKDAEKKEHPCFAPYDQLPEAQRIKDKIFNGIVNAFK